MFEHNFFPDQHLMVFRVWDTVSLDEHHAIWVHLRASLEQTDAPTDVLFDLRSLEDFPTSISQLRQASVNVGSSRLGWVVLLTDDMLLKFILSVLVQMQTQSSRNHTVGTMEAAIQLLERTQEPCYERRQWLADLGRRLEALPA